MARVFELAKASSTTHTLLCNIGPNYLKKQITSYMAAIGRVSPKYAILFDNQCFDSNSIIQREKQKKIDIKYQIV